MKIESSTINMHSFSHSEFKHETSITSGSWAEELKRIDKLTTPIKTTVIHDLKGIQIAVNKQSELSDTQRLKKDIIEQLLQRISGKKEITIHPSDSQKINNLTRENLNNIPIREITWGFAIQTEEKYYRKDSIDFNSKALIKTEDGKQMDINLSLSFSKEFTEIHKSRLVLGNSLFADPLIINYKDSMTNIDNLSNLKFAFDINNDKEVERIPLLKDGAGFLALDKNNNGYIDNGSELFGTNSGNGFADLKKYDTDNNNWIDENDTIFNNLRIWEKNDKAEDKLITLSQAGIGALYLSSIDSVFDYHQSIDTKIAHLKQTSFFVKENGKAGLITGVDFVI